MARSVCLWFVLWAGGAVKMKRVRQNGKGDKIGTGLSRELSVLRRVDATCSRDQSAEYRGGSGAIKSGILAIGRGSSNGASRKLIKRNPPAFTSIFCLGKSYVVHNKYGILDCAKFVKTVSMSALGR